MVVHMSNIDQLRECEFVSPQTNATKNALLIDGNGNPFSLPIKTLKLW
jgi:hypothetical protein